MGPLNYSHKEAGTGRGRGLRHLQQRRKTWRGGGKEPSLDQGLEDPFGPPGPSPRTRLPETDSAPLAAFEPLAISRQPLGPNQNTAAQGCYANGLVGP